MRIQLKLNNGKVERNSRVKVKEIQIEIGLEEKGMKRKIIIAWENENGGE